MIPASLIGTSRGPRLSTWAMAAAAITLACVVLMRLSSTVLRHAVRVAVPAVRRHIGWFWRLTTVGKVAVTAADVVLADLGVRYLPLGALVQRELMDVVALVLVGLLLASILFGSTKPETFR